MKFFFALLIFLFAQLATASKQYDIGLKHYQKGDFAKAYCIWVKLAQADDTAAQYILGWMYANGEGLAVNAKQAVLWWEKAASLGSADAHFILARSYVTGDGVKRNKNKAIELYLEASQLGHEDARSILFNMVTAQFGQLNLTEKKTLTSAWRMLGTSHLITSKYANIRSGPGSKNSIITVLKKGNEVVLFKKKRKWLQVGLPKQRKVGWLHQSLVE
jgi:TPR repeat protein